MSEPIKKTHVASAPPGDEEPALGDAATVPPPARRDAAFAPGAVIGGRYRIVRFLAAGGMGEVHQAEDTLLRRAVALKTIRRDADDERAVRRFLREIELALKVTHPNVCRIYDVGLHQDEAGREVVFLSMELLAGETLAQRLRRGRLTTAAALPIAQQLCAGIDAAHAAGIIHRDFKSANVILVGERVVVTDFGLARTAEPGDASQLTATGGGIVGTPAYMAPEQVTGEPLTRAVDVYALGVVLFELVTGQLPFAGETPLAVASKRLQGPPPSPRELVRDLDPTWERVILRCLERRPEARFPSTRDVALALVAQDAPTARPSPEPALRPPWPRLLRVALGALVLAGAIAATALLVRPGPRQPLRYTPLSFRLAWIRQAHYAPDGSILYTGLIDGVSQVYALRPGSAEVRPLFGANTTLLDVSADGELLLGLGALARGFTLARASLGGGEPRPLLDDVMTASFSPDGKELMVVRRAGERLRLEYPVGHVLLESDAFRLLPRLSPRGDAIAFVEQRVPSYSIGRIEVLTLDGRRRPLTDTLETVSRPLWSPDGREVWFATDRGRSVRAVTLDGKQRALVEVPVSVELLDRGADGRLLLQAETWHHRIAGILPGHPRERDLSWFEISDTPILSDDGTQLLTSVVGDALGPAHASYLRVDDRPAVQLGPGNALALSPDGRWALVGKGESYSELELVPTGPGTSRPLARGTLELVTRAFFLPDGRSLILVGREAQRPVRVWQLALDGGTPRPLTDEGVLTAAPPSPDGAWLAVYQLETQRASLVPVPGGAPRPLDQLAPGDLPIAWAQGGRELFVRKLVGVQRLDGYVTTSVPVEIDRFDLERGVRTPWRALVPGEPAGMTHIDIVAITPDGSSYAYAYGSNASELLQLEGLR